MGPSSPVEVIAAGTSDCVVGTTSVPLAMTELRNR